MDNVRQSPPSQNEDDLILSGLLAGATDQNVLEKTLEKKLLADLRKRENENDEKRLRRTRDRISATRNDLDRLNDQLNKPNLKISSKKALLDKIVTAEEHLDVLQREVREIEVRMGDRDVEELPATGSDGPSTANGETTREMLIRTGKITPFDRGGEEDNRAQAGRSVKDLTMEKQRIQNSKESVRPPPAKKVKKDEDGDEDFTIDMDDSADEYIPEKKPVNKNSARIEDSDDEENEEGEGRRNERRIARFTKENPDFSYDSDDSDSPLDKDIASEPFHKYENDLVLSKKFTVPGEIASKLFPYQLTTISWLLELYDQQVGGILGDEMGLGKTIQMISFMAGLHRSGMLGKGKPILVVAPATVLRQWAKEFHEWWGAMRVVILHSSGSGVGNVEGGGGKRAEVYSEDEMSDSEEEGYERKRKRKSKDSEPRNVVAVRKQNPKTQKQISELVGRVVEKGHVILTTYEGVRVYRDQLLPITWAYAVLDEGHKIRNADADITLVCKKLRTPHRIILSGTPIQNNLKELWSLYDFVFPGRLGTLPVFLTQFEVPIRLGAYANASNIQVQTAQRCASVLRDLISPYLLRRLKCDVAADLPQKTESVLFCKLTKEQRKLYEEYVESDAVLGAIDGKRNALGAIDGVRKICNHPDLLNRDLDRMKPDYGCPSRSGKMQVVKALLSMWKKQGHRALVFCQTRQMQEILEKLVANEGYKYFRMDGMTPIKNRIGMVDKFNADPSITVFLLTTKVGGLGINLTGANRVLIFDPDWNPSTDVQARERAWRLGQTRDVAVYRLMMSGTIEEKIYHRQIYKQFLTNKILSDPSGGGGSHKRFFDSRSMKDLFTLTDGDALGTETGDLFRGTEVVGKKNAQTQNKPRIREMKAPANLVPVGKGKAPIKIEEGAVKEEPQDGDALDEIDHLAKVEEFQTGEEEKKAKTEDDEESRMLFSLLHSTVAHDKIMNGNNAAIDPLTLAHADRVAREAAEEVRLSRKKVRAEQKRANQAHGGEYVGVVTFTGNSGSAGRGGSTYSASKPSSSSASHSRASSNGQTDTNSSGGSSSQPSTSLFGRSAVNRQGSGSGPSSSSLLDGLKKRYNT
ncbi:hypothetical protein BCR33DRAFT_846629 [Rhizoclosmatium globosum]|uniref:DNA repair and recombination protein RAD26 n=1 Tax=Rhizoclosmatium globosum TaxID=329046 RepID=A0A1Y2CVA8_9FUNG|nr:hypothetical protein BCR33DRAFT_846629 [Rhizoclosmatium globosum]|eukprot:ORY50968.1 hypothetical protein BCR33DRAFT_846629 [Rhizoclosmatium globosum]